MFPTAAFLGCRGSVPEVRPGIPLLLCSQVSCLLVSRSKPLREREKTYKAIKEEEKN